MPQINGFCSLRYNKKVVPDPSKVCTPPYDVISPVEQKRLYGLSPYNFIRLELSKTAASDTASNNRYTRSADMLRRWIRSGVLVRDDEPCLYLYEQWYRSAPSKGLKRRLGFLAAMRLDEAAVLRHEKTLAKPKQDRLKLLKKVRANLSPIFGLIEDPSGRIQKHLESAVSQNTPETDMAIDGVRHKLYAVPMRQNAAREITRLMKRLPMHIADGHHRFEVACQYRRLMAKKYPRNTSAPWNYVLAYFADVRHNPFDIFPTHRLIRDARARLLTPALKALGPVEKARGLEPMLKRLENGPDSCNTGAYRIGFYSKKDGFGILTLKPKGLPGKAKDPVARLDVSVLHEKVLGPVLGIREAAKSERIDFTRDGVEAFDRVRGGEFDAAFFLRSTSLPMMLKVSSRGLRMPQKSTYFYPKLLSGLVVHSL